MYFNFVSKASLNILHLLVLHGEIIDCDVKQALHVVPRGENERIPCFTGSFLTMKLSMCVHII